MLPNEFKSQRMIFKIHSSRLREAKWKLTLTLDDARRNEELIALGDSQMLRWIDELNGISDFDKTAENIKKRIKTVKKEPHSFENRKEIKSLYRKLDEVQFKRDFINVIIDRVSDYRRACRGFTINGIKYVRLLGTNGGVKNSTIIFVSERLAPELRRRIENGRDPSMKFIPAKYEAYRALTCSGSHPVSMPDGIAVVDDCVTHFTEDVITMRDGDGAEPVAEFVEGYEIENDESDGYGLMMPSLAEKWSKELGLDYVASGMNTRFSFEKGMVFTFNFVDFADKVAGTRIIKDAWGNDVDLGSVELILTTSMLKLWDAYPDMETYLKCCEENHYTFGIPKYTPETLESERALNYQFIQPYDLTDEDILELTSDSRRVFKDVLFGDYASAILFLKGTGLNESKLNRLDYDIGTALMAEPEVFNDPFVKKRIYGYLRKKIDEAKTGVINVHGNYSVVCGDPYALCQSMFGLPVTGLLKKGEIYNRWWADCGAEQVMCYRAPMTSMNNIRKVSIARGEEVDYWFRHLTTCTLINSWDTLAAALNGMDKDGDLVFLTDNKVLIDKYIYKPTVVCQQKKAVKEDITEDNLIRGNINSFGDDIGKITNYITSMFEVRAEFAPDSEEYGILDYRITCGEHLQQNSIDKSKGIISKPMPAFWHDNKSLHDAIGSGIIPEDGYDMMHSILADKKPYFMIYIYPKLKSDYTSYIRNTGVKCAMEFGMTIDELFALPESSLSPEQKQFVTYYKRRMPVGMNDCTMNRICRIFEAEFDGSIKRYSDRQSFDYTVLKSGSEYCKAQYYAIRDEYKKLAKRMEESVRRLKAIRDDSVDITKSSLIDEFVVKCSEICTDESALCDILLDICYATEKTKSFVWAVCGETIIRNLLKRNGGILRYPERSDTGSIQFAGEHFEIKEKEFDINA